MPEFVRVKLLQVDFGSQSTARDPYCAVSIKEAVADTGTLTISLFSVNVSRLANDVAFGASDSGR
jgi:hypothetical protein